MWAGSCLAQGTLCRVHCRDRDLCPRASTGMIILDISRSLSPSGERREPSTGAGAAVVGCPPCCGSLGWRVGRAGSREQPLHEAPLERKEFQLRAAPAQRCCSAMLGIRSPLCAAQNLPVAAATLVLQPVRTCGFLGERILVRVAVLLYSRKPNQLLAIPYSSKSSLLQHAFRKTRRK